MFKKLKEQKILFDVCNVLIGIIIVITLILAFLNQENPYFLITAFYAASLMNFINGIKNFLEDKRRTGLFLLVISLLVFVTATILLR